MKITTNDVWKMYYPEIYFFILKRIKNSDSTNEIIQNSFIKIHCNLQNLKDPNKVKAWLFRIVRNEIINFVNQNKQQQAPILTNEDSIIQTQQNDLCCFDKFINELPANYKTVVNLVYIDGHKLTEVAEILNISLANVKARVRRAKDMLKNNFVRCCKFSINENGKLFGEANCKACNSIK